MPDNSNANIVATGGGQGFPPDNADGTPGLIGPDEYTRQLAIHKATRGHQTVLAGNIADLQRIGAELANGKAIAGVAAAPGVDPTAKNVVTPAQASAASGEWTQETEREGLISAPLPPTPRENNTPNVIDPTATSPRAEAKTSSTTSTSTAVKK